jgi:hypothetical protein
MLFDRVQSIMPLLIRQPVIDCTLVWLLVGRIVVKDRELAVGTMTMRNRHQNCVGRSSSL